MLNGFALCKLLTGERGNPIDYIFLKVNKAFEKINSIKLVFYQHNKCKQITNN